MRLVCGVDCRPILGAHIIALSHKRNKARYNLLMAISNNKIIAYEITKESFNSEKYLAFITKNKVFRNVLYRGIIDQIVWLPAVVRGAL